MTEFNKDLFKWDGMYLTYAGQYEGAKTYGEVYGADKCHPSNIDMLRPAFIARFKYGRKPWKTWVNFLVKNFSVEEYLKLSEATSPREAMETKGFIDPAMKKQCREMGYPQTLAGWKQMISDEVDKRHN